MKKSPMLKAIPVMMFSSSDAAEDVRQAYERNANCYVRKPRNLDEFFRVMAAIEAFWFEVVSLPPRSVTT
jgi:two-component system, chemotaxis family, response regulator Rcp1